MRRSDLGDDPLEVFRGWLGAAEEEGIALARATVLATATPAGRPAARAVLIRRIDGQGARFCTSVRSRKGAELAANPRAALCSVWPAIERQVRLEGPVERLSPEIADDHWASRSRRSRLSALVSPQSEPVPDRSELVRLAAEAGRDHPGAVPRPDWWATYRVVAETIEFWEGRADRIHDRLHYTRTDDGWRVRRLAP